ncbi:MAG TPA: VOC family protein [Thermoanaerobaculia bacterium]|nr:VOC family protein [Thermoanaerobaculia bacterium]
MAERNLIERLDGMIDAILEGRLAPPIDPDLAMLAVLATDLRELPDPRFKSRLRGEILTNEEEIMQTAVMVTEVRPYFVARGADELIAFLKATFDAELLGRVPAPGGTVMHAEVRVGDAIVEMGDAGGKWEPLAAPMHVYVEDVDETYRRALAAGATSLYEPVNQPYGDREAGVVDRTGGEWFLARRLEGKPPAASVTAGLRVTEAERLLAFLKSAFGAEHLSGSMEHAELRLGESVLKLSEAHGRWGAVRGAFHLYTGDCDAAYEAALAAGASSLYAPEDQPYGERSGGVIDPWGNQWYIATPLAKKRRR